MSRRGAIVFVTTTASLVVALAGIALVGGIRLNLTPSEPLGIWRIEPLSRDPVVGDLVFICPPPAPPFQEAWQRGYLRRGLCAGGFAPLIKTVVALPSQHVAIDDIVKIDGAVLDASLIRASDGQGRPIIPYSVASCRRAICFSTHPLRVPMIPDILDRYPTAASSDLPIRSSPSIPDRLHGPILIGLSIAVGAIAWSGKMMTLPVAMFFPLLWAKSPSRAVAAATSAAYFLAASRGLQQGVANFYAADLWPGLLLWVMASAGSTLVHAVLWTGHPEKRRGVRYLLAMVLTGVPPFGIAGWAHPSTAAGVLFPGWGWFGLGATAILLVVMTGRRWQIAVAVLGGLYVWSATNWTPPKLKPGWMAVDLKQGRYLGRDGSLAYQRDLIDTVRKAAEAGEDVRVAVLPESALGFWTPTVARVWQEGLRGSDLTVITGAAVVGPGGYDNVMVVISADAANLLYRERMPVPGSMWQPWLRWTGQSGGARADFFGNPVVEVDGVRIAPLICYEQLILWPVLQSMQHSPQVIVAVGNGWWTENTSIVAIQKASVSAWARLFGLPVVMAFNT